MLGFSEHEQEDVVWELKDEGSVSDLETERDFLKSFAWRNSKAIPIDEEEKNRGSGHCQW